MTIVRTPKSFRIYILGQRYIKISRDVTFEENIALRKSKSSFIKDENVTNENNEMDVDDDVEF